MPTKTPRLRVTAVQAREVLGAEQFSMTPGKVTVLSGRNGSGKSSALGALQAALAGGNLAKLARIGADDEPEVVLVLEGEGAAYRVERSGKKLRVRRRVGETAGYEDVPRPQGWLSGLFDVQGANPVALLKAAEKDFALAVLEALPLEMARADLVAAMGMRDDELPPVPETMHPLEQLALIRDAVFRQRTGVNRDAKAKAQAAEQTRRNAPAEAPEDPGPAVEELQGRVTAAAADLARRETAARDEEAARLEAVQTAHDRDEERIKAELRERTAARRAAHDAKAAELRAATEKRIAELAAEMATEVESWQENAGKEAAELDLACEEHQAAARERRNQEEEALRSARDELAGLRETLAEARSRQEGAVRARALHQQAEQFDTEADRLAEEGARLTRAIEQLDAFRRRLASDLPIPGLEIDGREIRVDGIPFAQLNTAARIRVAVQVATLRAKEQQLPLVFIDGAEALDAEHFAALVEELKAQDLQAFIARVTDQDDLKVEVA